MKQKKHRGIRLIYEDSTPAKFWDRGRPARNEREARTMSILPVISFFEPGTPKVLKGRLSFCMKTVRASRSLRERRPRSQNFA